MVTLARSISYLTRINIGGGLVMHFMQTENDLRVNVYVYAWSTGGKWTMPYRILPLWKKPPAQFWNHNKFLISVRPDRFMCAPGHGLGTKCSNTAPISVLEVVRHEDVKHVGLMVFIARQHTDARYWYSKSVCLSVRLSVCLSVTFRYQMKTA